MYHYMHVDDLKISHAEKNVVEFVLKDLRNKFRIESPLEPHTEKYWST